MRSRIAGRGQTIRRNKMKSSPPQRPRAATTVSPDDVERKYRNAIQECGDIRDHLPTLRYYATQSNHVTEMGVRFVCSSWALLAGRPQRMISYDVKRSPEMAELERIGHAVCDFQLKICDVLSIDIEETDLLFIDTRHTYEQLSQELARHAPRAKRWIVLHDTETFGTRGEDDLEPGIWRAVEELVATGDWSVVQRFNHCNGLTVLARTTSP